VIVYFLLTIFLVVSSLEFPVVRFLVPCAKETLINEWDSQWIESTEEVHSLGWVGQKEDNWWKLG
jgi:hypothetical protein